MILEKLGQINMSNLYVLCMPKKLEMDLFCSPIHVTLFLFHSFGFG